jgi:hypothetical protein
VIRAAGTLRRAGQMMAGAIPAALMARLGMPALGAVVFLAVVVLAVTCWVIASGDRTDRVSQMMLARRGQASCPAPGTAAPPIPASSMAAARSACARRPGRSVSRSAGSSAGPTSGVR